MVAIIKSMLPESEKLPEDFYRSKTMIQELGLGYEKIDICPNHCMLYYKETSDKTSYVACTMCGHPRFKPKAGDTSNSSRDVPYSILRYFPITARLQHLFMSKTTAQYMKWHVDGVCHDESVITHPADADAWKQFDATHELFAQESRNVRLGLCTDGFNPFSGSKTPYSCWPVFVTPYNLPLTNGKIYGMKSHDSPVFMKRLIPLAFRDVLPKSIWGVLTDLSLFFKEICATEIRPDAVEKAEISIIEMVCKLEKIFPPAFFNVMEHLVIHIPYEAKVGGPVQYRWMYPFERQFENSLKELDPNISNDEILIAYDKDFSKWIKNQVDTGHIESRMIQQIAHGPSKSVTSYNGLKVNGYRFHTKDHNKNRTTMNSGFDPINGVKVDERYGLVDIKYKSRLQSNEPFVLAKQAQKIYYTKYPHSENKSSWEWCAACKVTAKLYMNETLHDPDEEPNWQDDSNDFYQESVSEVRAQSVVLEDEVISLFDANAQMEEVNVEDINCPMDTLLNDEFINDNEEFDGKDSESACSEDENEDYVM
ncbi:uncharacterized protein [Arachis hypogaea]|uniref:uncharacterized protein n=1 Tax=Arachis hypogaea TaxID=3818 RepID=UPI003B213F99